MNTKFSLLLVLSFIFVFASCKHDNENNNPNDIVVEDQIEQLVYPIPTPFEVTQMLQSSGTAYIADITNKIENADNYFKEKSKALNLGVYGADLAYASTYNQAQAIRDILVASKKLSDQLGLSAIIDQKIVERIEQNIDNADTLYKIVNNTYYDTFNKLNAENKGALAMLVISGAWIESIYLSTQLALTSVDKEVLANKIAEQKFVVNSLIPILEQYKADNQDIAEVIEVMKKFKNVFDKITPNEDGDVEMDSQTLEELMKIAKEERDKIVTLQ